MGLYNKSARFLLQMVMTAHRPRHGGSPPSSPGRNPTPSPGVTDTETVAYQKRELGKELLLLERHLQQGCRIGGRPCDCCAKHPLALEALAEETLGMTGEPLYAEVQHWAQSIAPKTTAQASASGQHSALYPQMAVEARAFRKRVMGTADPLALLKPQEREKLAKVLSPP